MLKFVARSRTQILHQQHLARQSLATKHWATQQECLREGVAALIPITGASGRSIFSNNGPRPVFHGPLASYQARTFLKKNRGEQQGEGRPRGRPQRGRPGDAGGTLSKKFTRVDASEAHEEGAWPPAGYEQYARFTEADFVAYRDRKLKAYLESLSAGERERFAQRNKMLQEQAARQPRRPGGVEQARAGRLTEESFSNRPEGFYGVGFPDSSTAEEGASDANNDPEMMSYDQYHDMKEKKRQELHSKAEEKAIREAQEAVEAAGEHLGNTFTELNRRLMTYRQNAGSVPDAALELFHAEKEELFRRIKGQALLRELTPRGQQAQRLQQLQQKFDKQGEQWTTAEIDAFVAEYLEIYSNLVRPTVHTAELQRFIERPAAVAEASTNQLMSDLYQISATITEQTAPDPQFHLAEAGQEELTHCPEALDPAFLRDVRAELASRSRRRAPVDLDRVYCIVKQYVATRGLLPLDEAQEAVAALLLGVHPQQLEGNEDPAGTDPEAELPESAILPRYQKYLRSVLFDELKLDQSPRFKAFIADIAINTADLRENIASVTHPLTMRGAHVSETLEVGTGGTERQADAVQASGEDAEEAPAEVRLPVLDRFLNLMLSLHRPDFYKGIKYSEQEFATELGLAYGLRSDQRAVGYNLIHDPEYMLRYQVLALAKFHNYFGQMDQYMKEFARICVETGNQKIIRNLERTLNVEVGILAENGEQEEEALLNIADRHPTEVDPLVLAQPRFRFSAVGDKLKMIQNYQDLIRDQEKNREAIRLLENSTKDPKVFAQLTKDFSQIFKLVEALDKDTSNFELRLERQLGTLEKLRTTSAYIDESIRNAFLRLYGVDGIGFANMEDVYSPLVSGKGSMQQTREHLLSRGMSVQFADLLASKYIKKQEESGTIVTLIDFFDTKKVGFQAMRLLAEADMRDVCLNYVTIGNYSQLLNKSEQFKALRALSKDKSLDTKYVPPQKIQPVRPAGFQRRSDPVGMPSVLSGGLQMRRFSGGEPPRGRFFDFLRTVAQTDKKVQEEQSKDESTRAEAQSEAGQTDAKEEKKAEPAQRARDAAAAKTQPAVEASMAQPELADRVEPRPLSPKEKEDLERQKLIRQALKKYDIEFFKQFSFSGPDALKMSQKGLEQYIISQEDVKEVEHLLLAMIHQAYRLNEVIPNIELVLYKMFCSPITTKEQRKQANDKVKLLAGNIFADKAMPLHPDVYRSLLETLTMRPNKKHFKKITAYIRKFEKKEDVTPVLIDQLVGVGIDQRYPITLGRLIRDFIVQEDYQMHKATFMKFIMFLERSKGFEEDAKKFMILSQQSTSIQIDYEMVRPYVQRTMKKKGGPEIIKFFEQLRKNIKLNQSWEGKEQKEKNAMLEKIRKEFFDGLIKDLMRNGSHTLAEVVMDEKLKEKFPVTVEDDLLGLQIYAAQVKMPNYREKFLMFFDTEDQPSQYELTQGITGILAKTMMNFERDEFKNDRLALTEKLNKKMQYEQIPFDGEVFHNICHVYVESQLWEDVAAFLSKQTNPKMCKPQLKTVKFLKNNLAYIFQNSVRQELQGAIEDFEQNFFSFKVLEQRRAEEAAEKAKLNAEDQIEDSDLQDVGHLEKKAMRREQRKADKVTSAEDQETETKEQVKDKA